MSIESLAVNAVNNLISLSERLKAAILSKNTTVSWDGEIVIHKDGRQSKAGIKRVLTMSELFNRAFGV